MTKSILNFGLISLLSLLVSASPIYAQAPVTPESEPTEKISKQNKEANRIARDYVEIMAQLAELTRDYQDVYHKYQTDAAKSNLLTLKKLITSLKKNSTQYQPLELSRELIELSKELQSREAELIQTSTQKSLTAATRSLRQEVNVINDLLSEEVIKRLNEEKLQEIELRHYIAQKEYSELRKRVEMIVLSEQFDDNRLIIWDPEVVRDSLVGTHVVEPLPPGDLNVPPVAPLTHGVPEIPPVLVVTTPAPLVTEADLYFKSSDGQIGLTKELSDSVINVPVDAVIQLKSSFGNVDIQGWERNKVVAYYQIDMRAADKQQAKVMSDVVNLRFTNVNNRILIEASVPQLNNPKSKVVSSTLKIKVPKNNTVEGKASFGKIKAKDLSGKTSLKTNNCTVELTQLSGELKISSRNGSTELTDINGKISISNALSPITIERCDGKFDIDNSLASIDVSDSRGDLFIQNSGPISVLDHEGKVTIKNRNGNIEVSRLVGDLIAHNSYKPIIIEDIFGRTEAHNVNSSIDARSVNGLLTIDNKFGDITISRLQGGIIVSSQNGAVSINLSELINQPSSIFAAFGRVELSISDNADVELNVLSFDGEIHSFLPAEIIDDNRDQTLTYTFGGGNSPLKVTGKHSEISIGDAY